MAPAAPFNPPSADLPGKPFVPEWVPPPVTKENHKFAQLKSIDLSLLDSEDPAVVENLIQQVKVAIRDDGFLFLENYGISLEQVRDKAMRKERDLGHLTVILSFNSSIVSSRLHSTYTTTFPRRIRNAFSFTPTPVHGQVTSIHMGSRYEGSDPARLRARLMYLHSVLTLQRHRGPPDGIEQFNWYKPDWEDINRTPKCLHPFMDEIEAFCNYLTKSVNRRLLTLFSRVLELPDDYLWDNVQSHGSPTGEGYFRHALFRPVQKQTEEASKGLRMHGHTDFGLTTLLFSVPISCLQIWGRDEQWYYVPYKPGALVINIGDTLEIVSGGHFKATRHRVFKPPVDQLNEERLSLVLFNSSVGDLRMAPALGK
jgi:isopenicillin N synthase-like dioxygenase